MANPAGKFERPGAEARFRPPVDVPIPRLVSIVPSDTGLLAFRELDEALGLSCFIRRDACRRAQWQERPPCLGRGVAASDIRGGSPGTRMSTTQSGCAMIRRSDGSAAARRLIVVQPRRANRATSKRAGPQHNRPCQRSSDLVALCQSLRMASDAQFTIDQCRMRV